MRIYFAICDEQPEGTADDRLLYDALINLGVETHFKVWTDPSVNWSEADRVLIRSTWNYHRMLPEFLKWAEYVESVTKLQNPLKFIRRNSSKRYLLELEAAGLPIIPSVIESEPDRANKAIHEMLQKQTEIIIKPTVSASAELTFRLSDSSKADHRVDRILERSEILIQPFITSITELGELSLVFFGRGGNLQFSHAVQKKPCAGDFRVQSDFGGRVFPVEPQPRGC